MTLQIFNPVEAADFVAFTANDQKIAEQLLADCVEEIKQFQSDAMKTLESDGSPMSAAMATLQQLRGQLMTKIKVTDYKGGVAILNATSAQQVAIVLYAMSRLVDDRHSDTIADRLCHELLKMLLRRKLVYDHSGIETMLKLVEKDAIVYSALPVISILSVVERHFAENGVSKTVRKQLQKLSKTFKPNAYSADERKIGDRLKEILKNSPADAKTKRGQQTQSPQLAQQTDSNSPSFEMNTGEAWTNAMLVELGKLNDKSKDNWQAFLEHCATATSSKPTKKWLKQTRELVDAIGQPQFVQVLTPTLAAIGKPGECQKFNYGGHVRYGEETQIHDTHVDQLRGLVWATSCCDDESMIGFVGDAAEKCFQKIREIGPRSPKIGNAGLFALSNLASETAVAQLGRLKARAKHVSTRKQIAKAFERAAANTGMTETDLVELGVPHFGMQEPGPHSETIGDFTAEVTVRAHLKPELRWIKSDGKPQKSVPATVKSEHADALKALKKKLKEIEKLMPSVRLRLEQLFWGERQWSLVDFRKRYLDHPLVGVIARKLIWNLEVNGKPTSAFWHNGHFVDASEKKLDGLNETTTVTIWHPMQVPPAQVLQWRNWLEDKQISQPFKQAHREVYVLTDAERDTCVYSNRFASHIIRQHQFATLCHNRGWRYDLQGDWDSWNAPSLDLPQFGLRAEFMIEPLEDLNDLTESFIYTHLGTEQVRFLPLKDGQTNVTQPVPLEKIPKLIFSEVMRDIDLFIGVASIGNDPELAERLAGNGHFDYWQAYSFGELSQTAQTRKQTLETIVPRLKIADQCCFDDKFLVVKGKLRTYKIHMGSGNVLMSPNDQYLCVAQKRGSGAKRTDNIYLPFEGDNTLSLILSKAFLLAEDDKIKDKTIFNQIRLDH